MPLNSQIHDKTVIHDPRTTQNETVSQNYTQGHSNSTDHSVPRNLHGDNTRVKSTVDTRGRSLVRARRAA